MSTERSLWEMFVSSLQQVKKERNEKTRSLLEETVRESQKFRHLLSIPVGPDYQMLVDQVMNHDPYGTPIHSRTGDPLTHASKIGKRRRRIHRRAYRRTWGPIVYPLSQKQTARFTHIWDRNAY